MKIKKITSFFLFGLLLICQPAMALDLHTAKEQGLVGETGTGYLAAVKETPEVRDLVETINAKRKAHYQKIARRNNTPLSAVEQLAGKKALEKTPPGQFIRINGSWQKK
jgi:uncharacterized protein YdbL (DUF1318 family)